MFKSLVYSLITKGTVAFINFSILIISSRYLGVSSRGEISIFLLNIAIIQIICEVYTGYSIVHFIPKFDLKKIAGYGLCYVLIFCSLSNLIVSFLNKQVPGYEWIGYLISLLVILNTFNCVLILGKENIRIYNFLSFIQPFLLFTGILFYIFILRKFTLESYIFPLLFSFGIAFIISLVTVMRFLRRKSAVTEFSLKSVLTNGFVFQASTLMYIFVNRFSYYLLPDIANVGLYASASSLIESLLIVVNAISPVLLSRVANQGNTLKSMNITLALSKASFLFSALCILIICLLPEDFFIFILGSGFKGIKNLMLLYAPGILMVSLFGSISYYFSAIGKQKSVLFCYSLGFFTTLILAPYLVNKFNSNGAAYNSNISYLIMAIAICSLFMTTNKLTIKRFFSFTTDFKNLKELMNSKDLKY